MSCSSDGGREDIQRASGAWFFLYFSGFPSCMGAAGGSNVPTPCLSKDGYDHVNPHSCSLILTQTLVHPPKPMHGHRKLITCLSYHHPHRCRDSWHLLPMQGEGHLQQQGAPALWETLPAPQSGGPTQVWAQFNSVFFTTQPELQEPTVPPQGQGEPVLPMPGQGRPLSLAGVCTALSIPWMSAPADTPAQHLGCQPSF